MQTRKLTSDMPEAERRRWSVIRLDSLLALPGIPISADEATGEALMQEPQKPEAVKYILGPNALTLVRNR